MGSELVNPHAERERYLARLAEQARERVRTGEIHYDDREPIGECPRCGEPVLWRGVGRKPRWCSASCRQRAKEARRSARENEQPLSVVDGPARAHNADEWVEFLTAVGHRQLLAQVLRGATNRAINGRLWVMPEADELLEVLFELPAGAGARLRAGLPLPDAHEREQREVDELTGTVLAEHERDRRRIQEVEQVAYQQGYQRGYDAAKWELKQEAFALDASPGNREQRRAAQRAVSKKNRRP